MGNVAGCPCTNRTESKAQDCSPKPRQRAVPVKPQKIADDDSITGDDVKTPKPVQESETKDKNQSMFSRLTSSVTNAVDAVGDITASKAVAKLEQTTDIPTLEEIKLCFALSTVAYLGDDIAPEEHYSPALFNPKTGEPVPKEEQEAGLGPCLKSAFGLTMDHFINIQSSDTQGFIAHDDDSIVLCYRGSMQAQDWVTNAQTNIVPWKPFEHGETAGHTAFLEALTTTAPGVHQGHYNAFLSSKAVIEEHLLPQVNSVTKPTRLIVCGHSLGGSLATMALVYLLEAIEDAHKEEGLIELCFCTIGAPRCGNISFVLHALDLLLPWEEVDKIRIGRFVNKSDIVPYSTPASHFRHLGRAQLLTETDGAFMHDESDGLTEDEFVKGKVVAKEWGDAIKDHLTGAYRDIMFKCEETLKELHVKCQADKSKRRSALLELEKDTEKRTLVKHKSLLEEAVVDDVQMTPEPTPQKNG